MIFEAISNKKKWKIGVTETNVGWEVSLTPENGNPVMYQFSHSDYQYMDDTISFLFAESSYLLDVTSEGLDYTVYARGAFRTVKLYNEETLLHESLKKGGSFTGGDNLTSQMPGKISKIYVKNGDILKSGDPLLIMEAMKMENEMRADADCKIKTIHVKEGSNVESNTLLISFEKE